MTKRKRIGYVDATDFLHELGDVPVVIYPDIMTLQNAQPCWADCGIMKVEIIELEEEVDATQPNN